MPTLIVGHYLKMIEIDNDSIVWTSNSSDLVVMSVPRVNNTKFTGSMLLLNFMGLFLIFITEILIWSYFQNTNMGIFKHDLVRFELQLVMLEDGSYSDNSSFHLLQHTTTTFLPFTSMTTSTNLIMAKASFSLHENDINHICWFEGAYGLFWGSSAITTFVHARLQELHFNSPEQCQLNKRNGKFTEDGIQKAFAKVKTMANKHISDYTTTDNQEKDEKQSQNDKTGLGMDQLLPFSYYVDNG
ncbi:hypothetical protein Tco_0185330 [Tanacetum coccineum]